MGVISILVFQCETVLEIEPNNVKAFYRRGLSLLAAGEPNSALDDFNKVIIRQHRLL